AARRGSRARGAARTRPAATIELPCPGAGRGKGPTGISSVGHTIGGKRVAAAVRSEVRERVARLATRGVVPGLATVLVGDDPASRLYVGNKEKACEEVGMRSFGHRLAASTEQAELLALVHALGRRRDVHGILVQLPLPAAL